MFTEQEIQQIRGALHHAAFPVSRGTLLQMIDRIETLEQECENRHQAYQDLEEENKALRAEVSNLCEQRDEMEARLYRLSPIDDIGMEG